MKILIIGCGRVGKTIANDLNEFELMVIDSNSENLQELKKEISFINAPWDKQLLKHFSSDLIINALPGSVGHNITKELVGLKKNIIDISFAPEDHFELKELANKNNVFCAIDCGIAPGFSNMVLGDAEEKYQNIKSYTCYVGGLPREPEPPFNYKAGFSPSDVIEEYIRPARLVVNGDIVTKTALSDIEEVDMMSPTPGDLEAFNTDGLRTMLYDMKTPNIIEKTVRFKGHAELMKVFRDIGLFNKDRIVLTSELLFKHWEFKKDEEDFTTMKIVMEFENGDKKTLNLLDVYQNNETSMARTTGFTCTGVVRAYVNKHFENKFYAPEDIGKTSAYNVVTKNLTDRGVTIKRFVDMHK